MKRLAVLLAALVAVLLVMGPAHGTPRPTAAVGGPTKGQPATRALTAHAAHRYATIGADMSLGQTLPNASTRVASCTGGPMLWRCGMRLRAADTACTANLWIWADDSSGYYEFHRLRCTPRT